MKKILCIIALFFTGCMSSAQKAQQQAQINQMVAQMTPEQRGQLAKEVLERMSGLDETPQPYQPTYTYPAPVRQTNTYCYPNGDGGMYCNTY